MKKRDSFNQRIGRSKHGQITVFIILGIILLFAFILVYQITAALNENNLNKEKQKILNKLFQPAALNLYIDDCLKGNLQEGLKLLGQQGGKFWVDQPGGYAEFSNLEGVEAEDPYQEQGLMRVAYGLAYYPLEPENKYPCTGNVVSPDFCKYIFPQLEYSLKLDYSFGSLSGANIFEIEASLGNYLSDTTATCIENALNKKMLTGKAEVKIDKAKVIVSLQSSGVQVEALYPMVLFYGKEKIGTQQKFSFTLPGKYKQFFEGVSNLLYNDIHFLDFNMTRDYNKKDFSYQSDIDTKGGCKLQQNTDDAQKMIYLCNGYNDLTNWGIEVERKSELFIFKSADPELQINAKDYFFQVYRQNRPPVLDYISQWPSETYDYLVIPGDKELGILDLTAHAQDPDEDAIIYSFSGDVDEFQLKDKLEDIIKKDKKTKTDDPTAVQTENFVEDPQSPIKIITVTASDGELSDWQEVRVLVEKEPKMNLKILSPYSNIAEAKVSLEDPVFVEVDYPETLSGGGTESSLSIAGKEFSLEGPGCYYLDAKELKPLNILQCDSAAIKKQLSGIKLKGFTNSFTTLGPDEAQLQLSFIYPENPPKKFDSEIKQFSVKECLPHQGSLLDKDFFKSHSCCTDKFEWAAKNIICKKEEITQPEAEQSCNKDGILQGKFIPTYCSGQSSYCDSQPAKEEKSGSLGICGKKGIKNCELVKDKCSGYKPSAYLFDKSGVCLDCQNFCDKTKNALVYTGKTALSPTLQQISLNKDFACGCSGKNSQPCDSNFDGFFKGTCEDNKCSEESP